MKSKLLGLGAFALFAGSATQAWAVDFVPSTQAQVDHAGATVASTSDASSPTSFSFINAGGAPATYGGGAQGTAMSFGGTDGALAAAASVSTIALPGGDTTDSKGDANLDVSGLNNTGFIIHAYLDFSVDLATVYASNSQADGVGSAEGALYLYAFPTIDGVAQLSDSLLYKSIVTDYGDTASSLRLFGSQVTDTGETGGCGSFVSMTGLAGTACSGGFKGTVDLGVIGVGQTFALNINLNANAFTDALGLAGISPIPSSAGAITKLNPDTGPCLSYCTFFTVRADYLPAVPEPASWALMIGGLGLVGGALRRRGALVPTT